MGRRGTKLQTAAQLRLTGQYRHDRHRGRDRFDPGKCKPRRPSFLRDHDAKAMWDDLTPHLFGTGIAGPLDTRMWASVCRWYAEYRKCDRDLYNAQTPEEKRVCIQNINAAYRLLCLGATRFGLTPSDRAALGVERTEDENQTKLKTYVAGA